MRRNPTAVTDDSDELRIATKHAAETQKVVINFLIIKMLKHIHIRHPDR